MAVSVEQKGDRERGDFYEIDLSASGDVAQAHLQAGDGTGLDWAGGKVGWHKTGSVTATFTNAGGDAMAVSSGGNGALAGWVAHPNDSSTEAAETLPITGLRFAAGAADQKVLLYVGKALEADPVDAGTPA